VEPHFDNKIQDAKITQNQGSGTLTARKTAVVLKFENSPRVLLFAPQWGEPLEASNACIRVPEQTRGFQPPVLPILSYAVQ
jgi:hypothetical protein